MFKKVIVKLLSPFLFLCVYLLVFLLKILEPIKKVRILWLRVDRIGHQAYNTDIILRRLQLKIWDPNCYYIFIASARPANAQLFKMHQRVLRIIKSNLLEKIFVFISHNMDLYKYSVFLKWPGDNNEYYEYSNGHCSLSFNREEEEFGKKDLKKMNITEKDWFVCLHSRDSAYLSDEKFSYHDYRDSKIENYLKAAEYITSLGGFVVRMGEKVQAPLKTQNPKIIDYATLYRSDFLDIYLSAKCKFFIGNTSGIFLVSTIFDRPSACANYVPYPSTPFSRKDIFIPKLSRDKLTGKYLSFEEIYQRGVFNSMKSGDYIKANIVLEESSADDILAMVQEMNEMIDKGDVGRQKLGAAQLQYLKDVPVKMDRYNQNKELAGVISSKYIEKYAKFLLV